MKFSVIGAGFVGATTAFMIADRNLGNVVLVDIMDSVVGKALDMQQAMSAISVNSKITGTTEYDKIADSDIVVITAGFPRKPGMDREELLAKNASIIDSVCKNIKLFAPNSIVIIVTNPLDVMAYHAYKQLGFQKNKVIGMAGVLDSARFKTFLAEELNAKVNDIECMVLGGHGDSMVPLMEHTTFKGESVTKHISESKIIEIVERTKHGGAEIVKYLGTGSAYYAPASSVLQMIEAILNDSKKILPCSVLLEGEYGYSDIFLGVPATLGKNGIVDIIKIELSDDEKKALDNSAKIVKTNIEIVENASK